RVGREAEAAGTGERGGELERVRPLPTAEAESAQIVQPDAQDKAIEALVGAVCDVFACLDVFTKDFGHESLTWIAAKIRAWLTGQGKLAAKDQNEARKELALELKGISYVLEHNPYQDDQISIRMPDNEKKKQALFKMTRADIISGFGAWVVEAELA